MMDFTGRAIVPDVETKLQANSILPRPGSLTNMSLLSQSSRNQDVPKRLNQAQQQSKAVQLHWVSIQRSWLEVWPLAKRIHAFWGFGGPQRKSPTPSTGRMPPSPVWILGGWRLQLLCSAWRGLTWWCGDWRKEFDEATEKFSCVNSWGNCEGYPMVHKSEVQAIYYISLKVLME